MSDAASPERDQGAEANKNIESTPAEVSLDITPLATGSKQENADAPSSSSSSGPSSSSHLAVGLTSLPDTTAAPSGHTSPSAQTSTAQTPEPTSTVNTLQLASEALSSLPQDDRNDDSTAAAELLSAFQQKTKKIAAIRSPHPGSVRSRSAATTPVPPSIFLGVKQHDSFDVTANSSRATTPTPRTPSGRAKRRKRERNAATPLPTVAALPSIESNDRRRSARVAKAVTTSASDSPNMPNLALFGFSPYLENLVMNAKETDRRTRSGGRGIRPPIDRAPTRAKRASAKSKGNNKEADPDGPDDDAKLELYRQLCIISYQLQADLDMVPAKSLEELRAQFATPPPHDEKLPQPDSLNASRATTPLPPLPTFQQQDQQYQNQQQQNQQQHQTSALASNDPSYQHVPIVKTEPPQSPQLTHVEAQKTTQPYSPESSPEVALMQTVRPSFNQQPYHIPSYAQPNDGWRQSPETSYPWTVKVDEPEDEPMSPVYRPARGNIMSISALMDGPSPVKARSPTPELIRTPPRPETPIPSFMQEWTHDDEMASQFLQACAAAIPKLDTTELDRLTQIAQLAAFDLPLPSTPASPEVSTPPLDQSETERREAMQKYDPKRLNPLDTLDTRELYAREEADYLEEMRANEELYESVRYLSSFDEVVDDWRAGELSRLRLQLEMRKAEVGRIWECDRKMAWSNFINDRAGELYRKAAMEARHTQWQAEMELDLLAVHRRKTRGLAKLTQDIWLPEVVADLEGAESADLYKRYGKFLSAAKYGGLDDPLVRADLRKIRKALRSQKHSEKDNTPESTVDVQEEVTEGAVGIAGDTVADIEAGDGAASEASSYESSSEEEYESDSSYASSGISSLPSFSSAYSSPRVQSIIVDADMAVSDIEGNASEVGSLRDADADGDSDVEAEESLWARQIRLANQQAAAASTEPALSTIVSDLQAPAEPVAANGIDSVAPASAIISRVASPAPSATGKGRNQQSSDKKRKRRKPPPPALAFGRRDAFRKMARRTRRPHHRHSRLLKRSRSDPANCSGRRLLQWQRRGKSPSTRSRSRAAEAEQRKADVNDASRSLFRTNKPARTAFVPFLCLSPAL